MPRKAARPKGPTPQQRKPLWRRVLRFGVRTVLGFYGLCLLGLLYLILFPPLFTTVQLQRQVEAWANGRDYSRQYTYVPREAIADDLAHALVAAEDARFYEHFGIDWQAVEEALEDNRKGRRRRGGSTITQQLVKNLFLTTHSAFWRKALEVPLTFMAELLLSKARILELYLNVIEWGDGVYGAEAAARYHYRKSAKSLDRYQSARLAACVPAPRTRRPRNMHRYSSIILRRMQQMGY